MDAASRRVCQILWPVILCGTIVVANIKTLEYYNSSQFSLLDKAWDYAGFSFTKTSKISLFERVTQNMIVAAVFLGFIVLVTLIVLFIFYMGWITCLTYYFYLPSIVIMSFVIPAHLRHLMEVMRIQADIISTLIFVYNFTVVGFISIFQNGPLCLQQFYLIINSAAVAIFMVIFLPDWVPWLSLAVVIFWDVFAVLSPIGPLRMLIKLSSSQDKVIMPGMVYSTDSQNPTNTICKDDGNVKNVSLPQNQASSDVKLPGSIIGTTIVTLASGRTKSSYEPRIKGLKALHYERPLRVPSTAESNKNVSKIVPKRIRNKRVINGTLIKSHTNRSNLKLPQIGNRRKKLKPNPKLKPILNGGDHSKLSNQSDKKAANTKKSGKSNTSERSSVDGGINIGLGDFVFYGLLLGLNSRGVDWYATIASFASILMGLIITLTCLMVFNKALPALPISIVLGLISSSISIYLITPLANAYSDEQIFT